MYLFIENFRSKAGKLRGNWEKLDICGRFQDIQEIQLLLDFGRIINIDNDDIQNFEIMELCGLPVGSKFFNLKSTPNI